MFSKKTRRAPDQCLAKNLGGTAADNVLSSWTQVRRCHRCGTVHQQLGDRVFKCEDCGAHFAPYFYAEYTPDSLATSERESLVLSTPKNYRPVVGISWWWSDSSPSGESIMPRA